MRHYCKLFMGVVLSFSFIISDNTRSFVNENNTISQKNYSYDHLGNNDISTLYDSLINKDVDLYQTDYYANYYFKNLKENFGNNVYGTCTYVAMGMLLSFYDSYWDDAFIPEVYDIKAEFQSNVQPDADFELIPLDTNSPGIAFENSSLVDNLTIDEYIDLTSQKSNTYFQFKLIELAKTYFGSEKFDSSINPLGLNHSELIGFLSNYLYDYISKPLSDVSIESNNGSNNDIRLFTINKIKNGIPVLLRAKKPNSNDGHAMIAYDYDTEKNEIYVHTGWRKESDNTALTHASLTDLGYSELWDATTIEPKNKYEFPMNYHSSSGFNLCSSNYAFPRDIELIAGDYRDTPPTYKWKSLFKEKWNMQHNPYIELSILKNTKYSLFTISNIQKNEYTLSMNQWHDVLANTPGNTYYVYLRLNSKTYPYFDEIWSRKLLNKSNEYLITPNINPDEYGFADAYPTDNATRNEFIQHNINGLSFKTRRYRTGYIHNEYIVMSPIRSGINEAFIEYEFLTPISTIDVELSHWRSASYEWLRSDSGTATIDAYINNQWITQFDMLDPTNNLPVNRVSPKHYIINFDTPVYNFRFRSTSNQVNSNNDNRGRICIGNIALYPDTTHSNVSDKSSSFSNAVPIGFEDTVIENYQNSNDIDYYVYTANYTNYFQFNIQSMWTLDCLSKIEIFKENDFINPLYSYTNQNSITGDILSSVPELYGEQGDRFYFKVYKINTSYNNELSSYYAKITSANYADCDSSEFVSKEYVSSLKYVYNGTNSIYVYFDDTAYETNNAGLTYKSIVLDAMEIWNKVGRIQWIEVTNKSQADTIVYSYYEENVNTVAYYNSIYYKANNEVFSGELYMNKYHMESYSYNVNLFACVHELGHGLGLNHINYNGTRNIMNEYVGEYTKLGQGDLAAYRYLWG